MESYISLYDISEQLDICEGDILLIGSDITRLAIEGLRNGERFDADRFINSFINKIGPQGTLLFPTFNWGFCNGEAFDYYATPSLMGSLTNAALKRKDFIRTKHPIYSFAVWGRDSELLHQLNNISSFGQDSPFAYLYDNQGKMLIIGLDYQRSFTFVHYVEECEQVKYRYSKDFTGNYIGDDNSISTKTYSMYVRDLEQGVETRINPIGLQLEKEKASTHQIINKNSFYVINLEPAFHIIQRDIRNHGGKSLHMLRNNHIGSEGHSE